MSSSPTLDKCFPMCSIYFTSTIATTVALNPLIPIAFFASLFFILQYARVDKNQPFFGWPPQIRFLIFVIFDWPRMPFLELIFVRLLKIVTSSNLGPRFLFHRGVNQKIFNLQILQIKLIKFTFKLIKFISK